VQQVGEKRLRAVEAPAHPTRPLVPLHVLPVGRQPVGPGPDLAVPGDCGPGGVETDLLDQSRQEIVYAVIECGGYLDVFTTGSLTHVSTLCNSNTGYIITLTKQNIVDFKL